MSDLRLLQSRHTTPKKGAGRSGQLLTFTYGFLSNSSPCGGRSWKRSLGFLFPGLLMAKIA